MNLQEEYKHQSEAFERRREALPKHVAAIWYGLVGHMREYYYVDKLWDGEAVTFCSNGDPFVKMILAADHVTVRFIDNGNEQSAAELTELAYVDETIKAINEKRPPDRELPVENRVVAPCGSRCDLCLLYVGSIEKQDRRDEASLGFAKCYGDGADYSAVECGGCRADRSKPRFNEHCDCAVCAEEKGVAWCPSCVETGCAKLATKGIIDIGQAIPGLTADEVTHLLLPYWTKNDTVATLHVPRSFDFVKDRAGVRGLKD